MDLESFRKPEGALIEKARASIRPKLSGNKAAKMIGLSSARWHQIVRGVQMVEGVPNSVRGPAATVADMARVVGLTPDDLDNVGRPDAAEVMRELLRDEPVPSRDLTTVLIDIRDQIDSVVRQLRRSPAPHPGIQMDPERAGRQEPEIPGEDRGA